MRHKIEMGDSPSVRKNPYRLPHAFQSVVDEQTYDTRKERILCPLDWRHVPIAKYNISVLDTMMLDTLS